VAGVFEGAERGGRLGGIVAAAVAFALALLVTPAAAGAAEAGPTRAEYVERVEPICERETEAHGHLLQGVQGMVQRGESERAAPRLIRAAAALHAAVRRIAAVPQPPADAERLGRWLGFADRGEGLLRQMAAALRNGERGQVQVLAQRLLHDSRLANATVVGFRFDYCRVSPARFA
jgi:hypothetical protein